MKKISLKQIEIIGAVFGSLLGSLDHFLYDWTHWVVLSVVSPINESPWEHLKLYFFPVMLFLIVEWYFVKNKRNLLFAKTAQVVLSMAFIIGFFYSYTGLFHYENVWIDIASFFAAMAGGYALSYAIIESGYKPKMPSWFWAFSLVLVLTLFQLMTWAPYHVGLFRDKPTGTFSIARTL